MWEKEKRKVLVWVSIQTHPYRPILCRWSLVQALGPLNNWAPLLSRFMDNIMGFYGWAHHVIFSLLAPHPSPPLFFIFFYIFSKRDVVRKQNNAWQNLKLKYWGTKSNIHKYVYILLFFFLRKSMYTYSIEYNVIKDRIN